MDVLRVTDLCKGFGGVRAVDAVSFGLSEGSLTALIGPNGSGKTTLFNIISGFLKPDRGGVYFCDTKIDSQRPYKIARLGVGRTFQNIRLFNQMTVLDNVMLAMRCVTGEGLGAALFQGHKLKKEEEENENKVLRLLSLVNLIDKRDALAGGLSYGQRKLLEIVRLLALEPTILLLDEPMAGLSPGMVITLKQIILDLKSSGKTILFIEHAMNVVMDISDKVIVLNYGKKIAEASPAIIQKDDTVIKAYLGHNSMNGPLDRRLARPEQRE